MAKNKTKKDTQFKKQSEYKKEVVETPVVEKEVETIVEKEVETPVVPQDTEEAVPQDSYRSHCIDTLIEEYQSGTTNVRFLSIQHGLTMQEVQDIIKSLDK